MLLDDKKNIAQNPYRRPYACGVLEVSSLLQTQEDPDKIIHEEDFKNTSFSMPLYLWYTFRVHYRTQDFILICAC